MCAFFPILLIYQMEGTEEILAIPLVHMTPSSPSMSSVHDSFVQKFFTRYNWHSVVPILIMLAQNFKQSKQRQQNYVDISCGAVLLRLSCFRLQLGDLLTYLLYIDCFCSALSPDVSFLCAVCSTIHKDMLCHIIFELIFKQRSVFCFCFSMGSKILHTFWYFKAANGGHSCLSYTSPSPRD